MTGTMRVLLLLLLACAFQAEAQDEGAAIYQRECAACHLPDAAGVPGAFPRLAGRIGDIASSPAGRAYLAAVVLKGLMGPIEVDGATIAGVMPPKPALSDEQISQVLNALMKMGETSTSITPFTASELAEARKRDAALSMQDVARLRPPLGNTATP